MRSQNAAEPHQHQQQLQQSVKVIDSKGNASTHENNDDAVQGLLNLTNTQTNKKSLDESISTIHSSSTNNERQLSCFYRDLYRHNDKNLDDQTSDGWRESRIPFPVKLHFLLSEVEGEDEACHKDVIAWQHNGRSFLVHQEEKLQCVLRRWYKQADFQAFQRLLESYGFNRMIHEGDKAAFHHRYLIEGFPRLSILVSVMSKGNAASRTSNDMTSSSSSSSTSNNVEPVLFAMAGLKGTNAPVNAAALNPVHASRDLKTSTKIENSIPNNASVTYRNSPTILSQSRVPSNLSSRDQLSIAHSIAKQHQHDSNRQHLPNVLVPSTTLKVVSEWKKSRIPFPIKLFLMLSEIEGNEELEKIISWQSHGRCFIVHNKDEFLKQILPCWYKQSDFPNFRRQLDIYGFKRITHGLDMGGYYHQYFLRGVPRLAILIKGKPVKGTGTRKPSEPKSEPNFYEMPILPRSTNNISKLITNIDTVSPPTSINLHHRSENINLDKFKMAGDSKTSGSEIVASSAGTSSTRWNISNGGANPHSKPTHLLHQIENSTSLFSPKVTKMDINSNSPPRLLSRSPSVPGGQKGGVDTITEGFSNAQQNYCCTGNGSAHECDVLTTAHMSKNVDSSSKRTSTSTAIMSSHMNTRIDSQGGSQQIEITRRNEPPCALSEKNTNSCKSTNPLQSDPRLILYKRSDVREGAASDSSNQRFSVNVANNLASIIKGSTHRKNCDGKSHTAPRPQNMKQQKLHGQDHPPMMTLEELSEWQRQLEEREEVIDHRDRYVDSREKYVDSREKRIRSSLSEWQNALEAREKDLDERQKAFAALLENHSKGRKSKRKELAVIGQCKHSKGENPKKSIVTGNERFFSALIEKKHSATSALDIANGNVLSRNHHPFHAFAMHQSKEANLDIGQEDNQDLYSRRISVHSKKHTEDTYDVTAIREVDRLLKELFLILNDIRISYNPTQRRSHLFFATNACFTFFRDNARILFFSFCSSEKGTNTTAKQESHVRSQLQHQQLHADELRMEDKINRSGRLLRASTEREEENNELMILGKRKRFSATAP